MSWEATLVPPDDFAVLAGDVELEHVPTLGALYELKGNLRIHTLGDMVKTTSQHADTHTHTHAVSQTVVSFLKRENVMDHSRQSCQLINSLWD